jgi:outer membrane protein OmpA-like peptidoglycan-associated protein
LAIQIEKSDQMTKNYFQLFLFLTISPLSSALLAQEEDEACISPGKKTEKLIASAKEEKDRKKASELYREALTSAPGSAMVYYEYGMNLYENAVKLYESQPNPAQGDRMFESARDCFLKSHELCSDYHASVSYYLGVIAYSFQDMPTAAKWFKEFTEFKHEDNARFPDDFSKKVKDVNEVLGDMLQEAEMLTNQVPFDPSKVRNVSSANEEYFPMISPDNELVFYTRKLDRANLGDIKSNVIEEFTFSQRPNIKADFDAGNPVPKPFNDGSFTNYGSATLSVDNKEMIICACKTEDVMGQEYLNCDLYTTTFVRSGKGGNDYIWSPLKNMGTGINTQNGWEAQPTLSADGNTLYYTANRPTTRDNDIMVAQRKPDGSWGDAVAFDVINTAGKDKSPFLHQDSETLYFVSSCSDKRKGFGGLDIFYIRKENGAWTEPKNIGYPINTKEDEIGLIVSTDGKLAYYASKIDKGWDIYSFELYEQARPKNVAILKGELKDEKGQPVKDATVEVSYSGTDEITQVKVNGDDGKYAAVIKTDGQSDVMVTVKKEGHAFDAKLIEQKDLPTGDVTLRGNDLSVRELKVGEAYTINNILYATSSYALTDKSKFILKSFARFLTEHPTVYVSIQGHTDDVGEDTRNLTLSENRAKGVKDYLISLGIDATRLSHKGFGETKPKVPNTSDANRSQNRRTDFVIEKM